MKIWKKVLVGTVSALTLGAGVGAAVASSNSGPSRGDRVAQVGSASREGEIRHGREAEARGHEAENEQEAEHENEANEQENEANEQERQGDQHQQDRSGRDGRGSDDRGMDR